MIQDDETRSLCEIKFPNSYLESDEKDGGSSREGGPLSVVTFEPARRWLAAIQAKQAPRIGQILNIVVEQQMEKV